MRSHTRCPGAACPSCWSMSTEPAFTGMRCAFTSLDHLAGQHVSREHDLVTAAPVVVARLEARTISPRSPRRPRRLPPGAGATGMDIRVGLLGKAHVVEDLERGQAATDGGGVVQPERVPWARQRAGGDRRAVRTCMGDHGSKGPGALTRRVGRTGSCPLRGSVAKSRDIS